jgi:hypothetical protein
MSYVTGHMLPDYRGGFRVSGGKMPESTGWFADTSADGLYISRFDKGLPVVRPVAGGLRGFAAPAALLERQFHVDLKGQLGQFRGDGPGVRVSSALLPKSMWITANLLRGAYLINAFEPPA